MHCGSYQEWISHNFRIDVNDAFRNILTGVGLVLFLVGITFWYLNWPELFRGRISGLMKIGGGFLIRFFGRKKEEKECLSST
jgi:hypothetical protein